MNEIVLWEAGLRTDYQGLHVNFEGEAGINIAVTVLVPEGQDAGIEHRNEAKAIAIRKAKALFGEGAKVDVRLRQII